MHDKHFGSAVRFFAMALAFSWLFTVPLALSGASLSGSTITMVVYALGGLGPAAAAAILLFRSFDRVERSDYWRRLWQPSRIKPKWLFAILGLVPAITIASALIDSLFGGWGLRLDALHDLIEQPLSIIPFALFILLFGPLPEELGWRGFGLDQLLRVRWPVGWRRWRFIGASLFVGVIWALWHGPLYFIEGSYQQSLVVGSHRFWQYIGGQLVSSFLYTWLFFNTNRSTASAILFHFSQNFTGELVDLSARAETISFILTGLVAMVALWRLQAQASAADTEPFPYQHSRCGES